MKKKIIRKVIGGLYQPEFISYPVGRPITDIEHIVAVAKKRGHKNLLLCNGGRQ